MQTALLKGRAGTAADREPRRTGFRALYRKELRDYFRSARFLIVMLLIAGVGIASVYSATQGFQKLIEDNTYGDTQYMFLNLFILNSGTMPSFGTFMAFLGPIVGLSMGFDAINGERSRRTLSRLLAQPIYRDAVINGKFLAGVTVISIMVFSLGFVISGAGMVIIGLVPTVEELLRIIVFLTFTVVYISLFLAISLLLSLLLRHTATSALTGVGIWLFFAIFLGMLASGIANALYPVTDNSAFGDVMKNLGCVQSINRLSPATLYTESVSAILNPSLRSVSSVFTESQYYQSQSYVLGNLPLGQSLLLVWPHLTGLLALTMICFAISYVCFMKQEIRAE